MIKKVLKFSLRILLVFLAFIAIYLLSVWLIPYINCKEEVVSNDSIPAYIISNGVHTDIVVPVKTQYYNWSNEIPASNTIGKDSTAKWLAFGWGDKGFYLQTPTWSDLKFSVAFKAACGLSSSAMHCSYIKKIKETENCKKLTLSKAQYLRLVNFINKRLQKDDNQKNKLIITTAQYGSNDAFYEANGAYNLFYTCNTWTNEALKACGQKAAIWTAVDKGILMHY